MVVFPIQRTRVLLELFTFWSWLMLPIGNHLRKKGVLLWVFLDDFLIIAPTRELTAKHTE